jgi:hypothetical protein
MVIGGQLETDGPEWANQISDRVELFFFFSLRPRRAGETTAVARGGFRGSHAPASALASPTKRCIAQPVACQTMLQKMFLLCADGTRLQAQEPKTSPYIIIGVSIL